MNEKKPGDVTEQANAFTEERNRGAARASIRDAKTKLKSELDEGLEESFPASDPLSATRPGGPVEDAREHARPGAAEDAAAIRALVAEWMRATRAGDTAAILALMTDDVVFTVPGQEPFGKEAFAAAAAGQKGMEIEGSAEVKELKLLGDWAFTRVFIRVAMTQPGAAPVRRSGYTLTILNKGADGKWRIARDANMLAPEG
jgi:uncharacterized protein (TIGR02246 family)